MNNVVEFAARPKTQKFKRPSNRVMIDERLVHSFIEHLMFLGEDDSEGSLGQHRLSEFWSETSQREQAKHLTEIWTTIVEFSDPKNQFIPYDPYETMFDFEELKDEINTEFKANHRLIASGGAVAMANMDITK